jgi:uncharacterized protein (TIGR03083 family)
MAAAAHGEVGGAFAIVPSEGDEPAMRCKRRIHFGGDERLDLGRELVVVGETLGTQWCRLVRIAQHEATGVGVVERGTGDVLHVLARDDDPQSVMVTDLVGERRLGDDIEREVVAKIFARAADDFEPQPETIVFRLFGAKFEQLGVSRSRQLDDRLAQWRGSCKGTRCHRRNSTGMPVRGTIARHVTRAGRTIVGRMALDYVAHILADTERMAQVAEIGPLDAPVTGCPGWNLRQLVGHMGFIHRWANEAATTAARPTVGEHPAPEDPAELATWLRAGVLPLVETLRSIDPTGPTWHPFTVERVGKVWPRRQAQEVVVHRWDAEQVIGATTALDPELASDGIDEYWEVMLPRRLTRGDIELPTSSLHVHCTDTPGEWTARVTDGTLTFSREHAKGDAALRGRAEDLLLTLWGRPSGEPVDIVGDQAAATEWLKIGGN